MPTTKHRDDQLFAAQVTFDDTVQFNGAITSAGDNVYSGNPTFSGDVTFTGGFIRTKQIFVPAYLAKAGATAGWAVGGADSGLVTLPQSQTGSTLIIPIPGLAVGDLVTGIQALAQIESAGGTVSWAIDAYQEIAAAADFTQTAIGTQGTGSVTADTYIGPDGDDQIAVGGTFSVAQATGNSMYAVLAMTTAASTDVAFGGLLVDVTTQ